LVDPKIITLLTLDKVGNYTKTAAALSLTQPAVSHHIRLLEQEYGIKIFYKDRKELKATPEGKVLIEYAHKAMVLSDRVKQSIEDVQKSIRSFTVGITTTLGEYLVPQIFESYCRKNPEIHINIETGTIKKLYNMLRAYELDWAIVEGVPSRDFTSILLDTDYLCLVVSPKHRLAKKKSVSLQELKAEKLILRPSKSGTRSLFENHLLSHSENINNFNILIEIDNITTIKELVASNLGVTIISHSACKSEEASGKLVVVPVQNLNMIREINLVYNKDFKHTEILDDIRNAYSRV